MFWQAKNILDGRGNNLGSGQVRLDREGHIIELVDRIDSKYNVYEFLSPAFINSHCHLELSHLKRAIPEGTGIPGFIQKVQRFRNTDRDMVKMAASAADYAMKAYGTIAVGDISNSPVTMEVKLKSSLRYHTFVESFGFDPKMASEIAKKNEQLVKAFREKGLSATGVPHAPYSVSSDLIKYLLKENFEPKCIHMQESLAEDDFIREGKGELTGALKTLGVDLQNHQGKQVSPLLYMLSQIRNDQKILFVHGTMTQTAEMDLIKSDFPNAAFCACPRANLYIEETLPDYPGFHKSGLKMLIGTDSLASNYDLDIWAEIETIQNHYPEIPFEEIIAWATGNAADFFGWDDLGKIEVGKKPGLLGWKEGGRPRRLV